MGHQGLVVNNLIKERDELEVAQKAEKDRMKSSMDSVEGRIHRIARVVNERVEERSVSVELRCNLTLGLVEEVRVDTGEIVVSRAATKEDKLRAQVEAQTELPGAGPA
jgi:hypothetical protein